MTDASFRAKRTKTIKKIVFRLSNEETPNSTKIHKIIIIFIEPFNVNLKHNCIFSTECNLSDKYWKQYIPWANNKFLKPSLLMTKLMLTRVLKLFDLLGS